MVHQQTDSHANWDIWSLSIVAVEASFPYSLGINYYKFSGSKKAMTAYSKNLIFGLCSTILSKYFSSEIVVSFEKPSPRFPHHLSFLFRNSHITFSKHFSTALLLQKKKKRILVTWLCHTLQTVVYAKARIFLFHPCP